MIKPNNLVLIRETFLGAKYSTLHFRVDGKALPTCIARVTPVNADDYEVQFSSREGTEYRPLHITRMGSHPDLLRRLAHLMNVVDLSNLPQELYDHVIQLEEEQPTPLPTLSDEPSMNRIGFSRTNGKYTPVYT